MSKQPIRNYMMPHPYTIELFEHLGTAAKMMAAHRIRHLPVVDGPKIFGIISDRDLKLAENVYGDKDFHANVLVRQICLAEPYVVPEEEELETVVSTMAKRRLGSAIVTRNGVVTGIFTTVDACRLLAEAAKAGKI